jgi:HD-GYP domain-containing protein (c-di-GMP phosphodiesterase class II)/putative methionine-R-sulfoxide reductase with GAF domain
MRVLFLSSDIQIQDRILGILHRADKVFFDIDLVDKPASFLLKAKEGFDVGVLDQASLLDGGFEPFTSREIEDIPFPIFMIDTRGIEFEDKSSIRYVVDDHRYVFVPAEQLNDLPLTIRVVADGNKRERNQDPKTGTMKPNNFSSLEEQITSLQRLIEIDTEILAARDEREIFAVVCRGAASLLKTPQALIISQKDEKWFLDSEYGFQNPEQLTRELQKISRDIFQTVAETKINNGGISPPIFLSQTFIREEIRACLGELITPGIEKSSLVYVLDKNPRGWTENEILFLKTLANQTAIALEKMRIGEDTERRAIDFAALYEISTSLSGERDLQFVLSLMIESIGRIMKVPDVFIYLFNEKNNSLKLAISLTGKQSQGPVLESDEGLVGLVASTKKPHIYDMHRDPKHIPPMPDLIPYSSVLEVPMLFGGNLIGILGVGEFQNDVRNFSEQDERLLSMLAAQAASAIYNVNLFDSIQRNNQTLDRLNRALNALIDAVSSNVVELSERISQIVVAEFQQANCSLWLIGKDANSLQRMSIVGEKSSEFILKPLMINGDGLIPLSVREGKLVNIPDVLLDGNYLAGWSSARSELVIPLKSGEEVIGALDLQSDEPNAFHEDDARILSQFAGRASMMLEHIGLVAETQQALLRLSAMHTVDIAVASSLDLQVTLKVFLEQVSSQLSVDAADILLLNPSLQVLEYAAGRGFRGPGIRRYNLRVGEDAAGRAALERMVVGISRIDSSKIVILHPERIASEGFKSVYAVPLIARGKMKGVLELYFRNQFTGDIEWQNFVETIAHQAAVAIDDAHLFEQLQQSYTDLAVAYNSTIQSWAHLLELRKVEPEGHCRAVSAMSVELAGILRVPELEMMQLYRGALLHDIGKLAIPDSILLKPDSLSEAEWDIVHTHPVLARDLLVSIEYLRSAAVIPYAHHERWDGGGYPLGLAGGQIPFPARIFSVVDVWDSLIRVQPYRSAWTEWKATEYIQSRSGIDFDPAVVEAFLNLIRDGRNRAIADEEDAL